MSNQKVYFLLYVSHGKQWESSNFTLAQARKIAKSLLRNKVCSEVIIRKCLTPSFSETIK